MANINNIKVGNNNVDAIMFNDVYTDPSYYKFNFNEWVNANNGIMEISNNKIIISKFKPNVWLLHSPNLLKGTNCDEVCTFCRGTRINVTGLANNSTIFNSYYTTSTTTGAGGDVGKLRGLCFYPFSSDGEFLTVHLNYWDHVGIDSEGNETLPQLPDMAFEGGLRLDGTGRNQYGLFNGDKENKLIFPDELYGFNNTQNHSYYYAFGLFTNNLTYVDNDGYIDISNNPITIELVNYKGIDITTKECWNAYSNNIQIYHKDKTFDSCWKKYGFISYKNNEGSLYQNGKISVTNKTGYNFGGGLVLPEIIDLNNVINNKNEENYVNSFLTWNINIYNITFWDKVKEWYNNNTINSEFLVDGLFSNSNIDGELTLNINNYENIIGSNNDPNYLYLLARDFLSHSKINRVIINLADNHRFSVGQNMFRWASELTYCYVNKSICAIDCSGMFEFCHNLKTYPNDLIQWNIRSYYDKYNTGASNVAYTFEYTGLETIPSYNTSNRFADDNTIICTTFSQQMFNGSHDLTFVGPIVDVVYVNPTKNGNAKNIFSAESIEDIRIKNLNHGDWYLNGKGSGDNYHGYLPNLNQESIDYLINNLYDLVNNYKDISLDYNNSFENWEGYNRYSDSSDIGVNDVGYKTNSMCYLGKRFNNTELAVSPCHTNKRFTNLRINVNGLVEGDRLEFGSGVIAENENSIKTNGEYTINKDNDNDEGFVLYRDGETLNLSEFNEVIITIIDAFGYDIPSVNHATIYCPSTWSDKITDGQIQSAQAKGWDLKF